MKKKLSIVAAVLAVLVMFATAGLGAASLAPPKEGPPRESTPCYLLARVAEDITLMRDEGASIEMVEKILQEGISDPGNEKMMLGLARAIYEHPEITPTKAKSVMLQACHETYEEMEEG